jgi:hypothetical protein
VSDGVEARVLPFAIRYVRPAEVDPTGVTEVESEAEQQ